MQHFWTVNECLRTGLSDALKNTAPGQENSGFAVWSALLQQLARPLTTVGAKNTCPAEDSDELGIRRRATRGMPDLHTPNIYSLIPPF